MSEFTNTLWKVPESALTAGPENRRPPTTQSQLPPLELFCHRQ